MGLAVSPPIIHHHFLLPGGATKRGSAKTLSKSGEEASPYQRGFTMIKTPIGRIERPVAVTSIFVEKLFGLYTYHLQPNGGGNSATPRLFLLYGDNGSGKTTIVQLLFHLLSRADARGHRTYVARTLFRRFGVTFDNGKTLVAERNSDRLDGPYTISLKTPRKTQIKVIVRTSEDGSVKSGDVDDDQLGMLFDLVSHPSLATFFLSDTRAFQSDVFDRDDPHERLMRQRFVLSRRLRGDDQSHVVTPEDDHTLQVMPSISRAEAWTRRQALTASSVSEASTSHIYTEIVKRIGQTKEGGSEGASENASVLLESIRALSKSSQSFVSLGLVSPVPVNELSQALRGVDKSRLRLVARVLEPYIDSVNARLDALAEMQKRLEVFLDILNTFYKNKKVSLTVADGIEVLAMDGLPLGPNILSSGEKQLLLLLCNVLIGTSRSSLFLVDEPEISLNVKWQRQLVDSLLSLAEGSHVQFIMATHSIELLTRHKDSVVRLEDRTST